MQTVVLKVNGMSCGHCVNAVQTALQSIAGVEKAEADLAHKQVRITFDPSKVNVEAFKEAIVEEGYEVVS